MQVFYALIATASFILSATKAYMKYGLGWLCADVLGMVIGLAFLGIAVNELRHAQQSVLKNLASSPGFELDASVAPPPDQTPA